MRNCILSDWHPLSCIKTTWHWTSSKPVESQQKYIGGQSSDGRILQSWIQPAIQRSKEKQCSRFRHAWLRRSQVSEVIPRIKKLDIIRYMRTLLMRFQKVPKSWNQYYFFTSVLNISHKINLFYLQWIKYKSPIP